MAILDFNKPIKMCTRNSCCPTIEFSNSGEYENATIKDDFGGEVILSIDELEIMHKVFRRYLCRNSTKPDTEIQALTLETATEGFKSTEFYK